MRNQKSDFMTKLSDKKELTEEIETELKKAIDEFCGIFRKNIGA
jgi:hypothetical protein